MRNRSPNRSIAWPRSLVAAIVVVFGLGSVAQAHFLWIFAEQESESITSIHAFLAEQPVPESPVFLRHIEKATYSAGGKPIATDRGEDTFVLRLPADRPTAINGLCDFGVMDRGESNFRLLYTARAQFGPCSTDDSPELAEGLHAFFVEEDGTPEVRVTFNGEAAPGAIVKLYFEDGEVREVTTDDNGRVDCPEVAESKAALLAKWFDGIEGERDGKTFPETRHYATLTVSPRSLLEEIVTVTASPEAREAAFPLIPVPINSFGGAVAGDHLYVYSGHTGTTHFYHSKTTNPHFYRLDLQGGEEWEELPCGPDLQGVALVSHGGKLYRTGGMTALNEEGDPSDLISTDGVAVFDPETNEWADLPPMPEPRSTHDAAVLGDHLYVIGGWAMTGGSANGAYFLDDAFRLDLTNPEAGWEEIAPPPIHRRALAVAAHDGKIYMIGGLLEQGGTTRDVHVYDPGSNSWSSGPELPGDGFQGFAPSAFSVSGRLFASGGSGTVFRLSESGDSWESIAELAVPRITHRLLPGIHGDLLVVGGNFQGIPIRFVESVPLGGTTDPKVVTWSVELPGEAVQSQTVGVIGSQLIVAGGNRSRNPHDFTTENLTADAFSVPIDGSSADRIAPLPVPRQSGVLVNVRDGRRTDSYLLGGIGQDGEVVRTLGSVFRKAGSTTEWEPVDASIPDDRGMFGAVEHEGSIWVFGGSIFDPRPDSQGRSFPTEILRWQVAEEGRTFEETGKSIPTPRRSFAGAVLEGKYFMVGGLGEDQALVESVDVFDLATGEWGSIPAPLQSRVFADLAVLDGKLYLAGGFVRGDDGHFEQAETVEVFDPSIGSWDVLMEELPSKVNGLRLMAVRGRLLMFGFDADDPKIARFALIAPGSTRADGKTAEALLGTGAVEDQASSDSTR